MPILKFHYTNNTLIACKVLVRLVNYAIVIDDRIDSLLEANVSVYLQSIFEDIEFCDYHITKNK